MVVHLDLVQDVHDGPLVVEARGAAALAPRRVGQRRLEGKVKVRQLVPGKGGRARLAHQHAQRGDARGHERDGALGDVPEEELDFVVCGGQSASTRPHQTEKEELTSIAGSQVRQRHALCNRRRARNDPHAQRHRHANLLLGPQLHVPQDPPRQRGQHKVHRGVPRAQADPDLCADARGPARAADHVGVPRLGDGRALRPGDDGADDGGDVDGDDAEPDERLGAPRGQAEEGDAKGRLGPARDGDGHARADGDDDDVAREVGDVEVVGVVAEAGLDDEAGGEGRGG